MNARLAGLALALVGAPSSARDGGDSLQATGVPVQRIEHGLHYVVTGSSATILARQMTERGPRHPSGRQAWAYTAWELRARYTLVARDGGCKLVDPTVLLEVWTTLPRWEPRRTPASGLLRSWQRMLDRAAGHEQEHRRHALDAAQVAATAIANLPARAECHAIDAQVHSALRRARAEATHRSGVFDRETDYGRLQGVRLAD